MNCMIASLADKGNTKQKEPELTKSKDLWPAIKKEPISDFLEYNKK
jgi:hypothetical protein